MQVQLGGVTYELVDGTFITKQPLIEYPQHIRTTGQQERGGQTLKSNWWMDNFEGGFGCDRIDITSDRMLTSFWDSTAETVQRGQITNPRAIAAIPVATYTAPHAVYEYGGTVWGLTAAMTLGNRNKDYFGGVAGNVLQYTGTTWAFSCSLNSGSGSDKIAKNIDYVGGQPCIAWKDYYSDGSDESDFKVSMLDPDIADSIVNLDDASMTPLRWKWANSTRAAILLNTGETFYAADSATRAAFGNFGVSGTIASVKNMYAFQGQDGYEGMFIFYKNKLTCWENFDLDRSVPEVDSSEIPYLDLFGLEDDNNMADVVVFNGSLVFQVQDALLAYAADGSVMDIGMNMFSGMPSSKQGKVEALCSSVRHLYAAVNQTGIRQVFQFDGSGWHYFGVTPTMGNTATSFGWLNMITNPSGTPQLMLNVEGDATSYVWDYPDNNVLYPPEGGTQLFETSSEFITPEFDGGLPNQKGVAYGLSVEGVFGAGQTATFYYSTLGGATGWNALGQATISGRTTFAFGTKGVPNDTIQFKFGLEGLATASPVIRTAVLDYLKFPDVRDVFTFTLDLVKTNGANLASVQTSLDTLAGIRDSYEMTPFQYGSLATINIKILEMPAKEEFITSSDSVYSSTGAAALVTMRAVKLI